MARLLIASVWLLLAIAALAIGVPAWAAEAAVRRIR